jgi:hypothetical protein
VPLLFGCGTSGADAFFSDSVVAFIFVSPDRAAVVTLIALVGRNIKVNLQRRGKRRMPATRSGQLAVKVPFL